MPICMCSLSPVRSLFPDSLQTQHNPTKSKALAAREKAAVSSLARSREALVQSWEDVLEAERARIADTARAWRHCLLGACTKLRALVEESRRERSRTVESWNDEVC